MSGTSRWTGERVDPSGQATERSLVPAFGWRALEVTSDDRERDVALTLIGREGLYVNSAGDRSQSYDLEVTGSAPRPRWMRDQEIGLGKYEIKSLWRRGPGRAFDRRFKVGTRGETIYGPRDSAVKAFALMLESSIDDYIGRRHSETWSEDRSLNIRAVDYVGQVHELVDRTVRRRHCRSYNERIERLARAALAIPLLFQAASRVLSTAVTGRDIANGYSDLKGIFVVAGNSYTLVSQREIPEFLAFDSASSEGLKLRFLGEVPYEKSDKRSKQTKEKNGNKKR